MIAVDLEQSIVDLCARSRLSDREIAWRTGVNRGLVAELRRRGRPRDRTVNRDDLSEPLGGPIEACPACGRRIQMPCRACLAENYVARTLAMGRRQRRTPHDADDADDDDLAAGLARRSGDQGRRSVAAPTALADEQPVAPDPLALQLYNGARTRYHRIRAAKRRAEAAVVDQHTAEPERPVNDDAEHPR